MIFFLIAQNKQEGFWKRGIGYGIEFRILDGLIGLDGIVSTMGKSRKKKREKKKKVN